MSQPVSFAADNSDPCSPPYDAENDPELHRAYREGWTGRRQELPYHKNPYSTPNVQRAWTNGWQACHLREAHRTETD